MYRARLATAAALVLLASCTPTRTARKPVPPAGAALPAPDSDAAFGTSFSQPPRPLLTLGMSRPVGRTVADASQAALDAYLSQKLEGPVVTRVFDDAAALAAALVAGEVEAAWMTPLAYVRATERARIQPVVKLSRGGFTAYRSVIFARQGKFKATQELKGKKMAWVARGSTSGRLFPELHLRKAGLDPDTFFAQQVEGADHREVCLLVLEDQADAGATLSDELPPGQSPVADGCREAGLDPAKFVVLERTDPIPNDVIAVRRDLPALVVTHFRDALLALGATPTGLAEIKDIFQADGFADVTDADFVAVREVEALLAKTR
jgi:phosphonate transport system substrate-binding protein